MSKSELWEMFVEGIIFSHCLFNIPISMAEHQWVGMGVEILLLGVTLTTVILTISQH